MNKKGFTLIEVIVSVVLVSVIMVSLMASLIQLRKTYTLIHENSDILVYSSSIARVINNDLTKNNGIRYISCNESRKQCDMILGNDERRQIIIQEETTDMGTNESHVTGTNVKTTLRYINNTEEDNLKLVYIRTLELDRYSKNGKVTTEGYNFLDMTYNQTEYSEDVTSLLMDVYTTLVIRLYNGIEEDVSSYNVTLYTAGRYDESSKRGKIYTVNFDSSGATTVGTKSVDEVFGVGYFISDSNHTVSDRVYKIDIPTRNDGKVFLGYYYYNPSWPSGRQEEVIVDGEGRIVATSYFFKEDVANSLGDETILRVYAKWGDCKNGYELGENGRCVAKNCRVVLDFNDTPATGVRGTKTYYDIKYLSRIPDLNEATELPTKGGYTFTGYTLSSTQYHNNKGINTSNIINMNYNDASGKCITLKAGWQPCPVGYYSLENQSTCSKCAVGSIASTTGTTRCTPCSGKTTGSDAATSCNQDCTNNAHVSTWKTARWNDNNTLTNFCTIDTCVPGYHIENNKCIANKYTIIFNGNTNTGGSTASANCTYDQNCALTQNGFVKTGYTFTGWARSASGSKEYNDKGTALNLTTVNNGTYTLYAKWKDETAPTVTVTAYNKNGTTKIGNSQAFTPNASQNTYANTYTVNSGNWYGDQQIIKFEVSDSEGVTKVMWRTNASGKKDDTGNTYSINFTDVTSTLSGNVVNRNITQEGYRKIQYQFSDAIGNNSTITVVSKLDLSDPYGKKSVSGSTGTLTCYDDFSDVASGGTSGSPSGTSTTLSTTCEDNVGKKVEYSYTF